MNDAFTNQEVKGVDGDHVESEIGPRALGGRYRSANSGHEYDVLAVARDDSLSCGWSITVKFDDRPWPITHATPWQAGDEVVREAPTHGAVVTDVDTQHAP